MEDFNDLLVGLVVSLVLLGDEEVHVLDGRGVGLGVVLSQCVRGLQACVLEEVVVDDCAVSGLHANHGLGCVDRGDLHLGVSGVNIVDGGGVYVSVLEGDQTVSLQQLQRACLVHGVVRDHDLATLGDVGQLGVLLGEQSHRVDDGRADNLQVLVGADVVVRQVGDVLEAVHVNVTGVQSGVRLGVCVEHLVLNVDALLLGFFLQGLVELLGADHTDDDPLRSGGVRGGTASGHAENHGDDCKSSGKLLHGYESFC